MHRYFIKTPWLVKKFFPQFMWRMLATGKNEVYLTFDDGPHPQITPWVLDELKKHNALATFFCIGKNVAEHTEIYQRILDDGHAVGNHTHNHLNGWKVPIDEYLKNIEQAAQLIKSNLFRPPYGRIKMACASQLDEAMHTNVHVIMWDVLSADFDIHFSPEKCLQHIINNVVPGSIVVFHDSEKAQRNLRYALPKTLEYLAEKGFLCSRIELLDGYK